MSGCGGTCGCGASLPRRAFVGRGALGALGALVLSACGDGDIGGTYPTDPFPTGPLTINLSDFPELAVVGGLARVDGDSPTPVAIVRTGPTTFDAISLVCPHQGATVDLVAPSSFRCPSHLAEFSATGVWTGGKSTGDLTALGVTYDASAGTLTINGPAAPPPPPSLGVAPTSEVFTAIQGQPSPAAQTVSITNVGGGTLPGLGAVVAYGSGQPTGWLTATLDATTAPATLTLKPSTTTLAPGAYSATVQITSPAAANAPLAVSVSLLVTAVTPSTIALANRNVAFAAASGGANPLPQTIAITNGGGGTLAGLSVGTIAYGASASGWLAAALDSPTAPASLTLTASLGALAPGSYTATVPVLAPGASNAPQQVTVTFTVASSSSSPTLALSATNSSFSAAQDGGSPASQAITVQNGGGGSLGVLALGSVAYGAGGSGWLTATLSGSVAPAIITLIASPLALPAGTYTATVPVMSAGVANSPQNVTVSLTIGAAAAIAVSPSSISFSAPFRTNPGGQVVNITSVGGALSGLAFNVTYGAGATGWLSTSSLSGTSTPAALTLRAVAATLATGTYTATVQITATGAAAQSIAITLVVSPAGLAVVIANWPALATVGGIAGSVGTVQGTATAIVRTGANSFAAFSMRCPHQGTTIRIENWQRTGSAFHCPNHDALFDAAGKLLAGSPQSTSSLVVRTVTYTAGDTTLYVT